MLNPQNVSKVCVVISKHDQSQILGRKYMETHHSWLLQPHSCDCVWYSTPIFNKLNPFRAPPEQALLWPLVSLRLPADTVSRY